MHFKILFPGFFFDKVEAVTTSAWHSNGTAISQSPAATAPSSWYICFALLSAQLCLPMPLTLSPGAGDQIGLHLHYAFFVGVFSLMQNNGK